MDKWNHQQTSISKGQESEGTRSPKSTNLGHSRKKGFWCHKKQEQKDNAFDKKKQAEEKWILTVNAMEPYTGSGCSQPMIGAVQDVKNPTKFSGYAETRAGRCKRITIDIEQSIICTKKMRRKRWQYKKIDVVTSKVIFFSVSIH